MKAKLLVIANVVFLTLCISFAFYWNKIYDGGPREQKGDYILYCLKISIILTFLYLLAVKLLFRKLFPILLLLLIPLLICFVSVILALAFSLLTGNTGDVSILRAYLFIHGVAAIGFIYLLRYFAKKKKADI